MLKLDGLAGHLRNVVVMTEFQGNDAQLLMDAGLRPLTFDDVIALGRASPLPHRKPTPDSIYVLSYTSGTTGSPKGAMITHRNIVSEVDCIKQLCAFTSTDVHISYLPLAHIFEREVVASIMYSGGAIGFYSGDIRSLQTDLAVLRPTIIPSVPRIWNRYYD
jgi:long-chain acyl-CoA synthetase